MKDIESVLKYIPVYSELIFIHIWFRGAITVCVLTTGIMYLTSLGGENF